MLSLCCVKSTQLSPLGNSAIGMAEHLDPVMYCGPVIILVNWYGLRDGNVYNQHFPYFQAPSGFVADVGAQKPVKWTMQRASHLEVTSKEQIKWHLAHTANNEIQYL